MFLVVVLLPRERAMEKLPDNHAFSSIKLLSIQVIVDTKLD